MKQVSHYEFGNIDINGHSYHADVIITPDKVIDTWWRKQGHNLQIDDLDEILKKEPEILIIGTGFYGRMQVPAETLKFLEQRGIQARIAKTSEAVTDFNELQKKYAKIVAALHLTC